MMSTKREIIWQTRLGQITVPAGLRVIPCKDGTGQYWVNEFEWIKGQFYEHDARHYGIRVDPDNVEDVNGNDVERL